MDELKINVNAKNIKNHIVGLPRMLSRTMYCQYCDKYQEENIGKILKEAEREELFALHGSATGLRVQSFQGITPQSGMTPHLISIDEIINLNGDIFVIYIAFCGINNCGIEIFQKRRDISFDFIEPNYYNFLELQDFKKQIFENKNKNLYIK